ncbi:MAG: hypothetical protein KDH94_06310, partial [Coxiellaceae bacterium]|nr:hypothetical protein [Coxiellaceae bacterium]
HQYYGTEEFQHVINQYQVLLEMLRASEQAAYVLKDTGAFKLYEHADTAQQWFNHFRYQERIVMLVLHAIIYSETRQHIVDGAQFHVALLTVFFNDINKALTNTRNRVAFSQQRYQCSELREQLVNTARMLQSAIVLVERMGSTPCDDMMIDCAQNGLKNLDFIIAPDRLDNIIACYRIDYEIVRGKNKSHLPVIVRDKIKEQAIVIDHVLSDLCELKAMVSDGLTEENLWCQMMNSKVLAIARKTETLQQMMVELTSVIAEDNRNAHYYKV